MPEESKQQLLRLAYSDELTGLYNRRYLRTHLRGVMQGLQKEGVPLCLMVMDIDHFKAINDTYGHLSGDQLLQGFASILKKLAAKHAIPIRYAGDEFVMIIPKHDKQEGRRFGKEILHILKQNKLKISEKESVKITSSIGVASCPKDAVTYEDLFRRADQALYRAKEMGREQVFVYPDDGKMISPDIVSSLFPLREPVGRQREMVYFVNYIQSEPQHIPVLSGERGMGKTYLLNWAEKRASNEDIQTFYITGHAFRKNQPLAAIFSGIAQFREKYFERFENIAQGLSQDYRGVILSGLDLETADDPFPPEMVVSGTTAFFLSALSFAKTLLAVDEAQDMDHDSIRFLSAFLNQCPNKPVYPVFSFQRSPHNPAGMLGVMELMPKLQDRLRHMELAPFSIDDVGEYIERALGGTPFDPQQVAMLHEGSLGKPLLIQETLKNLISVGKLRYDVDQWKIGDVVAADLTMSASQLAKSRVKNLPHEVQGVLSKAAVIGESFDMPVLSELTDIPESQLYDVFRPAEEAHVIIEAPGHEGDFAFVNSAERDALLGLIAPEERKELNKRLVDIEQRLHLSHSNLILGRLVNHLVQGSQWQEATRLHERMASSYIKEPVSHEALEQLQRMTMTRVSAKEMPLSEDDLKRAARTARALKIAIQNLRLYPPTNENVRKSVEFVFKELVYFFSETEAFTISATPEAILINGSQSQTTETENIVSKLYDILNGLGLHGIMFIRGLTFDELLSFLEMVARTEGKDMADWDDRLKEKQIDHILPDRKVYLTTGQYAIAKARQEDTREGRSVPDIKGEEVEGPSDVRDLYTELLEEFRNESKKILEAANTGDIPGIDLDKLRELLETIQDAGSTKMGAPRAATKEAAAATQKEILPDHGTADLAQKDIWNAFEAFSTDDKDAHAVAAGRLLSLKDRLPEVVFHYIDAANPPKANRVAALLLKRQGQDALESFLSNIKPGIPPNKMGAILRVADLFSGMDLLYEKIREMIPHMDSGSLGSDFEKFLFRSPQGKADKAIIDLLGISNDTDRVGLLKMASMVEVNGMLPYLKGWLRRSRLWQSPIDPKLAAEAARASHKVPDKDRELVKLLVDLARPPRLLSLRRKVPEEVRVAALWSLGQIRPPEISPLLRKLTRDTQSRVALQAKEILET